MRTKDGSTFHLPAILLIDDDGPTLELYAGVLSNDYEVFTCSHQQDAVEILSTQALQLVVLEPAVAGYQGWGFLEEITKTYKVPVVVCSALDERRSGIEAGAIAYLVKPVLPSTLLEVLRSLLS